MKLTFEEAVILSAMTSYFEDNPELFDNEEEIATFKGLCEKINSIYAEMITPYEVAP